MIFNKIMKLWTIITKNEMFMIPLLIKRKKLLAADISSDQIN